MGTGYHAKYFAYDLTRPGGRGVDRLSQSLFNVSVDLNRTASLATTVEEQKRAQETVRELERKKRKARQRIFDVEDEIESKRDALIEALEQKMVHRTESQPLFMLKWTIT